MSQPDDTSPNAQTLQRILRFIAQDISADVKQVAAAVDLLDGGATVPFVARYRKEATGGLDDTQLRVLSERLIYLRELEARRAAVAQSIKDQDKLTDALAKAIDRAQTKAQLEDIYLPYKKKRRTKAAIARENGLEPLLDQILADRSVDPEALAGRFLNAAVETPKDALNGARDILAERLCESAPLVGRLRAFMISEAQITARVNEGKEKEGAKFADYFDHSEAWKGVPSHRALAMLRGANEGILALDIAPTGEEGAARAETMVAAELALREPGAAEQWLRKAAGWTWRVKLSTRMMVELMGDLRLRAQDEAIRVFARNLKDLLFAAPAGARPTLGLDPGIRTGVKAAVVDATGKVLATETLYPFQPKNDLRGAQTTIARLIKAYDIELIAIGNGTASRDTERMVEGVLKALPQGNTPPLKVVVSEAGASVYSASELAAREFPDLDVSLRGAVSIARRLQDPLAELVKIDPKSIGVGQYQHDVDQHKLTRSLEAVIEDVVNAVGVDVNMASAPLLAHVSGLGPGLAEAIVAHRDANGPFVSRRALLKVARLGPKAFEQCAGFLRIRDGKEPLDASAVHPETYTVARQILMACGRDISEIIGAEGALSALRAQDFVSATVGLPTVRDIFAELEKPGRDPRPRFQTARFAEGVEDITHLKPGMVLEGTVTNVAAFGAFVDIGVHQDGLVHVSQLADRFVKDPHDVVKTGQVVKVTVTEIDVPRKRIGLTMKKDGGASAKERRRERDPEQVGDTQRSEPKRGGGNQPRRAAGKSNRQSPPNSSRAAPKQDRPGALGAALMDAFKKK
ncbi:MAG: RNA-binding transcriptional accessory protein [Epibacterium sp.]|nr:RNA-binding transcriptional accessory protein [Epibacterium sp.]